MTTKYECDRCHKVMNTDENVLAVTLKNDFSRTEHTYHYCVRCMLYLSNAMTLVNAGKFDGVVNE